MKILFTSLFITISVMACAQTHGVNFNQHQPQSKFDCKYGINPLYVLDNKIIPCDSVNLIKMNDIDEIKVYNSLEATALYGSGARNGAVTITTKQYAALRTREKDTIEIEKP